jgi:hypothetical protein
LNAFKGEGSGQQALNAGDVPLILVEGLRKLEDLRMLTMTGSADLIETASKRRYDSAPYSAIYGRL